MPEATGTAEEQRAEVAKQCADEQWTQAQLDCMATVDRGQQRWRCFGDAPQQVRVGAPQVAPSRTMLFNLADALPKILADYPGYAALKGETTMTEPGTASSWESSLCFIGALRCVVAEVNGGVAFVAVLYDAKNRSGAKAAFNAAASTLTARMPFPAKSEQKDTDDGIEMTWIPSGTVEDRLVNVGIVLQYADDQDGRHAGSRVNLRVIRR